MTGHQPGAWAAKNAAKALLGYVLDSLLTGTPAAGHEAVAVPSPWDAWWACYRAGLPASEAGIRVQASDGTCPDCARRSAALAAAAPPGHPGTGPGPCGCLLSWAGALRSPGPPGGWPPVALSLALIKPGAPAGLVQGMLAPSFEVLSAGERALTTADTRRLYPEAYGASYVADRDAYLTSGPASILVLRARDPAAVNARNVKEGIRARIGGDALRNHLHMPDNPGETLADIAHFAGHGELADLHRRYERDHAPARLAFYRAALGIGKTGAHRLPAAG